MLTSETLHRLLLAGTCLCVYGNPVPLHQQYTTTEDDNCEGQCISSGTPTVPKNSTDVPSKPPNADKSDFGTSGHLAGLSVNIGTEGGAGPDGQRTGPEEVAPVTQTENGDSHVGRFGPSEAGEEAWSERTETETGAAVSSLSEMGEAPTQSGTGSKLSADSNRKLSIVMDIKEDTPVTSEARLTSSGGKQEFAEATGIPRSALLGFSATFMMPPQPEAYSSRVMASERKGAAQENGPWDEESNRASVLDFGESLKEKVGEINRPSSVMPPDPSAWIQRQTSSGGLLPSPLPSSSSFSPQASTLLSAWGQEEETAVSTVQDPILPEIGPNLTPRQDGPESVWTEAVRQSGVDTLVPLSQDEATEGTMSSEALPLIFDPLEDNTSEGVAAMVTVAPGSSHPPAVMATRGMLLSEADLVQLVTMETDSDGPSHAPPPLLPDWTSPWQTSGAELLEPISPSGPFIPVTPTEDLSEDFTHKGADRTKYHEKTLTTSPFPSSIGHSVTNLYKPTRWPESKSTPGLEVMESEEEPDEDEEDENTEESDEDESEEDLTETPTATSKRPSYSLIPPPPVWAQRNQGLMRSWVELIREKAGYVSGMLAPVGIGIMGALLIVGALYSIRLIHRKRRNSFKHQRRKVRQPEQPREPGTNRQDQAMLLADSSEDEF